MVPILSVMKQHFLMIGKLYVIFFIYYNSVNFEHRDMIFFNNDRKKSFDRARKFEKYKWKEVCLESLEIKNANYVKHAVHIFN